MQKKQCIAMLLAGGQGSRLGLLTKSVAKPAIPFGGKYRIIDFPLSNCSNSGIDVVGVLTQYQPLELNRYIGTGQPWDLDLNNGGVFVLPPYVKGKIGEWYRGTANAIYQNIPFIEQYDPEYVLILSGDHIYKMDYNAMLRSHIANQADCTIAVRPVPWADAPSFGIMNTDAEDRIIEFEEKPKKPKSNRASMGVYIFTWSVLRKYLIDDEANPNSHNDFGKNIIPGMLGDGLKLMAYSFEDYWKDVGTIRSLWESNMDLISETPQFNLHDKNWRIYARNPIMPPHYVGPAAQVDGSMVTEGCAVYGCALRSVLFAGVTIERGAVVEDSVIMPGAVIKTGAVVKRSIIGEKTVVCEGCRVGDGGDSEIALVGSGAVLKPGAVVLPGQQSDGREEEA
ncbi:MAG TPA: glucose-1-phosphate adenylyltransferase [Candidatus Excrementavichristensenella intestinipullorum]|nr:glucose-1-phosphate adenylyltransferase [Candidatus Excrementavichristensenella intestinipullorum]